MIKKLKKKEGRLIIEFTPQECEIWDLKEGNVIDLSEIIYQDVEESIDIRRLEKYG